MSKKKKTREQKIKIEKRRKMLKNQPTLQANEKQQINNHQLISYNFTNNENKIMLDQRMIFSDVTTIYKDLKKTAVITLIIVLAQIGLFFIL